jgi:uncharacterized spore protein YtfJ
MPTSSQGSPSYPGTSPSYRYSKPPLALFQDAAAIPPLGGAGGGVSVSPVTFIVIDRDTVKILSAGDTSTIERLIDTVPAVIDKIAGVLSAGEEEKDREN